MTIQLLNDRYQVIRTLGAGGFGETYLAEDTYMPSKRRCVVKQLRPIQNNPQIYQLVQERFQREAAILEELGGATEQIPALYAYFSADGQFYLVQEWVEGDTLTARLQQQGLFTESAIQELLVNLLPVLEYVHSKHIVHRDIKPDNIILRHRDGKPVLIDFGAVRESMGTVVNSQGNPTSSIVIGTPGYMPSEQAAGRPVYSSDLYSLGLTAIYLLTGRQPQTLDIDSQTGEIMWRQYASQINPVLASVLDKAIAYHPRDRYATARAMLDNLQSISSPIPPTQPYFAPPPVVSAPPQPTVSVAPPANVTGNNQKGILFGSLIAGGLIGASVIVGLAFTRTPQPVAENNNTSPVNSITETPVSNATPEVTQSPVTTQTIVPSPQQQVDPSPVPSITSAPIDVNINNNNYLWLSQQAVTDADLDGKDGYTLDIMRNTVFARHGRRFDNPGLQDYFNNQPWYNPIYSPKEFPLKLLTRLEQRNVDYIAAYQKRYNLRHFK
ncbi:serine/threonine protein kinase [Trichormus variabilis ATCC 29413]|uniref:non-specific serine/threonine protein kinase n=2 Tax=Anabaena variabilis TaxID=264691 RepID=Q3MCG4_TRIV2|nr:MULTISPECIES: YARHG domain-containing protein [Nostocaceae]ABA21322.1 serine/threonine protein kinase [Trichormus variabilis ATCC 29413]MBC1216646.1 YARHG domain-containing protein [Trichormus variabilis ARAD]MBC1257295.1 YARHG domain-containing protein [Trichormus variabilis V5]MBC1270002.1 YARHG domain-containing protein [Trichormus variabilis FSR]MBC1303109.1 YARHG domain-containing protein [Trichormus variabilis N2B]